ncbi:MAG: hypothetical protein O3C67_08360 [Cyanobacteria bacterium]|nr:hypothetical protein [Cyanobacteriota bacterium]
MAHGPLVEADTVMKKRRLWWFGLLVIALVGVLWGRAPGLQSAIATTSSVTQTLAQAPEAAPPPELVLSGTYQDEGERYQIALAEGFQVAKAAASPVFTGPDGSLAYSVVVVPVATETPLAEIALVELVQSTFGRGEGFQTQSFSPVEGGIQVNWTGNFTPSMPPSVPMTGAVVAQQRGDAVYLVMVAAQATAEAQVPAALSALLASFEVL